MPSTRKQTVMRLSDEGREILQALAEDMGLSQKGVVEILLRDRAEAKGIRVSVRSEDARQQDVYSAMGDDL